MLAGRDPLERCVILHVDRLAGGHDLTALFVDDFVIRQRVEGQRSPVTEINSKVGETRRRHFAVTNLIHLDRFAEGLTAGKGQSLIAVRRRNHILPALHQRLLERQVDSVPDRDGKAVSSGLGPFLELIVGNGISMNRGRCLRVDLPLRGRHVNRIDGRRFKVRSRLHHHDHDRRSGGVNPDHHRRFRLDGPDTAHQQETDGEVQSDRQ